MKQRNWNIPIWREFTLTTHNDTSHVIAAPSLQVAILILTNTFGITLEQITRYETIDLDQETTRKAIFWYRNNKLYQHLIDEND